MRKFLLESTALYAPETGVGTAAPEGTTPPPAEEKHSGPGSGRSSLRQSLEKSFEDSRKAEKDPDTGRFTKDAKKGERRINQHAEPEVKADAEDEDATKEVADKEPAIEAAGEAEAAKEDEVTTSEPKEAAPEGWPKEAKAEWAKTPESVRAAALKREKDMAKGVEELKARYSDIERAFQPHLDTIRQHGHTPAKAVEQMFGWFNALASNPDVAFPALLASFKYDAKRLVPGAAKEEPKVAAEAVAQSTDADVPPALQAYIKKLEDQVGELGQNVQSQYSQLMNTFQQQQQSKTEENLNIWAKDKPYFEEVRGMMAHLVGSGAIPLKDGKVDLDGAYDAALYANKPVREKVMQDQRTAEEADRKAKAEAEKKAQQAQAEKAKKAAVGLPPGGPGTPATQKKGQEKGKSVRESLQASIEELRS